MAKNDTKKDEQLVPVGPGAEETFVNEEDEAERPDTRPQQRTSPDPGDDEDDAEHEDGAEDERAGHSEGDDPSEDKQKAKRRRQRVKRKEAHHRDQVELRFLRDRNERLERQFSSQDQRLTQSEVLAIDGRINAAQDQLRQASEVYAAAVEKGDGTAAAEAQQIRDDLRDGLNQLKGLRQQTVTSAQARANPSAPSVDPRAQQRAREWAQENSDWFDPTARDEASAIAYTIEQRLMAEGRLDPATDAYWKEVDRRIAKRLPEIGSESEEDADAGSRSNGRSTEPRNGGERKQQGPTFRTGGRERALKRGEVYVDSERRKAMEDSGVWDDPVLRERYLKSYQKYDRQNGRRH